MFCVFFFSVCGCLFQQGDKLCLYWKKKEQAGVSRVSVAIDGIFKNGGFVVCALSPCQARVTNLSTNQQTAVFLLVWDQCARYINRGVAKKRDGLERFSSYQPKLLDNGKAKITAMCNKMNWTALGKQGFIV